MPESSQASQILECEGLTTAWTTLVKRLGLTISTFITKGDLPNVVLHGFRLKLV